MRDEDISLPSFPRNVNEAKYIPELAYHGLRLLCSPLHGAEDKVKVGKNLVSFLLCTAFLLALFLLFTLPFCFYVCAMFAGSQARRFLPPQSLFTLTCTMMHFVIVEFCARVTPVASESQTEDSCSGIRSLELEKEFQLTAFAWNCLVPC